MWEPPLGKLSSAWRCLAYDWRGHGGTGAGRETCSVDGLAADAQALLDALLIERVHWVGSSAGAVIGLALAIAAPARIASLTLAGAMARASPRYRALARRRAAEARRAGLAGAWEATARAWFTPAVDPRAVAPIRGEYLAASSEAYAAVLGALAELDLAGRLGSVRAPTLVLVGREDRLTTVEDARALHRAVPGSTMVVLEGLAHLPSVQAPERFEAVLEAFLEDADGADDSRAA
jgi:pimeloyl-ACP methyl ester carboxylesterase